MPFNWLKRIFSRDASPTLPETIELPDDAGPPAVEVPVAAPPGPVFELQRRLEAAPTVEEPELERGVVTGRLRALGVAPLWVPSVREPALLQRIAAEAALNEPAPGPETYAEARQRLNVWLELVPEDAEARCLRARAATALGDHRAARADLELAAQDPIWETAARAALEAVPSGEETVETPAVES